MSSEVDLRWGDHSVTPYACHLRAILPSFNSAGERQGTTPFRLSAVGLWNSPHVNQNIPGEVMGRSYDGLPSLALGKEVLGVA